MQFTCQTLDGATKPITGTPGRNGAGWGAKQSLPDVLGGPALRVPGWHCNSCQHPCRMLALVQLGSFALAFGRILDVLRLGEDCQYLDKAGGFTPQRFSVICLEK